ncbi:MAG TPA: serine hydrolase domain-containing protein [Phycisphaerae bacterium]|nr:serine hydrolase domain-containing protein [Phycisphaerae bacterium]
MLDLPKTTAILSASLTEGLHIGAQLHALIDGQPVADLALGNARLAPAPTPMTPDTLLLWLSAGKPITAVAIAMLVEQNKLRFDDEVATIIPEFAANGKDKITVRHLLTHTAGIRGMDLAYPFATWEETLAKIYAMKIERDWTPGLKAGYHAHTSWYVLGEIINRLTGQPHNEWIRDHILQPLGMHDTWLAMSPQQYHQYADRIGYLHDTTTSPPKPIPNYDTELAASRSRPAASIRGPAHDMTRFYEMLRNGGTLNNTRILSQDMVHALTFRQRVGMFDHTFRQTIDWGLGIILNSSHYGSAIPYQFGPHASASTFGHGGSQSSSAFCDPERNLVVALVFNGCPGEPAHDKRLRATLKALYEDLGLA